MPKDSNWRLYNHRPGIQRHAIYGQGDSSARLIDIHSSTLGVVSSLLSPLEPVKHIMVTYTSARTLEVSLPRFRLSFFVNANCELECRSMPGYVVDKCVRSGHALALDVLVIYLILVAFCD
jgi:hypothetical protein